MFSLGLFDFMRCRKDRLPPDKSNAFWLEHLSDFDQRCSRLTMRFHYSVKSALSAAGNASLLWGRVKFREEYVSKNNVYTLFAFHLFLFTVIGCRPVFFAQYLHKVEEWPNFLTLSTLSPRRFQSHNAPCKHFQFIPMEVEFRHLRGALWD